MVLAFTAGYKEQDLGFGPVDTYGVWVPPDEAGEWLEPAPLPSSSAAFNIAAGWDIVVPPELGGGTVSAIIIALNVENGNPELYSGGTLSILSETGELLSTSPVEATGSGPGHYISNAGGTSRWANIYQ